MLYFKDNENNLYVDPIQKNHAGLTEISKNDFQSLSAIKNAPPEKTQKEIDSELKLAGVLFEGVMCSASSVDMYGLMAVDKVIQKGGSVNFEFSNGNFLVITPLNAEDFEAVWFGFRMSFFPLPA